jgi:hypothetical protein
MSEIKLPYDAAKIKWWKKTNRNGEFEYSEDYNSLDHKALLKFLKELAGGSICSGAHFYWVYQNGSTIGRKEKKRLNNPKNISLTSDKMSDEKTSFVSKEDYQQESSSPPTKSALEPNNKLFTLLEELTRAMKENTVAVNALVTIQTQRPPMPPLGTTPIAKGETTIRPPATPQITPPLPTHKTQPAGNPFDEIIAVLPQTAVDKLDFSLVDGYVIIEPREFLGSDIFAKVASAVRSLGGVYVSAGKGSHFKVASR